jgi:mediator of RNA polymerase II transcription subunit 14
MELLVGEKSGPIRLEERRRFALGDDVEEEWLFVRIPSL